MCQVGEDPAAPAPEGPPPRPGRERACAKCKEERPAVVVRAGDAFCRGCFGAWYTHKFRAVLGRHRAVFPGEKVLLAWSGGPCSSALVWQVFEGLSRDSAKRLRFSPGVVYIDEGAACGRSLEERAQTRATLERLLRPTGFPWHPVALEEVLDLPPSVLRGPAGEAPAAQGAYKAAVDAFLQQQLRAGAEDARAAPAAGPPAPAGSPPAAQTQALSGLFEAVRTLTAKEELLQTLRGHLLLHVARTRGYSKVMTGESCTRLAVKLLTGLALGRGAFLAWDTGFSDERHGDVVVLRPLREHTAKEVAFHNRLFAVPSVCTPVLDTKAPEKASVHRLVEAFLLRLQARFPATVSTVFRTGEKLLKAPRDGCAPRPRCLLCACALDVDAADSATAFGAQAAHLSQARADAPSTPQARAGGPCGRPAPGAAYVMEQLCYGCRVTMKDLPSPDPLPPYILAEARLRAAPPCGPPGVAATEDVRMHLLGDGDSEPDAGAG